MIVVFGAILVLTFRAALFDLEICTDDDDDDDDEKVMEQKQLEAVDQEVKTLDVVPINVEPEKQPVTAIKAHGLE